MGEASAVGMLLEDGIVSRMLRPYERSHVEETQYPTEGKPFTILFLKLVRNVPPLYVMSRFRYTAERWYSRMKYQNAMQARLRMRSKRTISFCFQSLSHGRSIRGDYVIRGWNRFPDASPLRDI